MAESYFGGEFRKEGAKDRARWEGRRHFLRAVERFRVTLQHLEGTPLEAFGNAHAETRPPPREIPPTGPLGDVVIVEDDPQWRFENHDWDVDLNHLDPLVAELHREILQWGERRHLTDPWLLDVALLYLRLRHRGHPWDAEDPFVKGRFPDPRFVDTDENVEFVLTGWHPMWEPWSTYEKKVGPALAKYRLKREAWAKSQRTKPGIKKRGVDVGKHFKWLARYQIGEKSYETIANKLSVGPTAVAHAVRDTAELIGLTLRDVGPGGRKPPP